MPLLKITDVISFSSEDSIHVAENVLTSEPTKKWRCQKAGEKSASIILQLEKASVISSVNIGNEGSAYVEILVNRSGSSSDFKVLLVMSSFMSPVEARQGTNTNKLRMFTADQLSKPECTEKWDRIKIVCTQPFNKQLQYGLSFVSFYSPEDKSSEAVKAANFGKFTLRPDSPDDGLQTGSLFARRKELQSEPLRAAAAIRDASSSLSLSKPKSPANALKRKHSCESVPQPKKQNVSKDDSNSSNRNRNELLYKDDEDKANDKIEKALKNRDKEKELLRSSTANTSSNNSRSSSGSKTKDTPRKNNQSETSRSEITKNSSEKVKKEKRPNSTKPYDKLLEGVIFVISGIQNPERSDLRATALSMGAKYKADWENGCTHLICAYANTPKFNQVKGKGKIATKRWITDCKAQRKKLPWRRYALDPDDKKQSESEDEIWEEKRDARPTLSTSTKEKVDSKNDSIAEKAKPDKVSDGSDTEDEIERIQLKQPKKDTTPSEYDIDTEDEAVAVAKNGHRTPELPEFFTNLVFYIDENIPDETKTSLNRYIVAFNGDVETNFTEIVTTVVSTADTVSILKLINPEAAFVSPGWIWECHNTQKFVPIEEFFI